MAHRGSSKKDANIPVINRMIQTNYNNLLKIGKLQQSHSSNKTSHLFYQNGCIKNMIYSAKMYACAQSPIAHE